MKRIIIFITVLFVFINANIYAENEVDINAQSGILMEADSGNVLFETEADKQLPIASVTKIMTMLLICEAIDSGDVSLGDMVTVSKRAMDMGGSTMFLEEGDSVCVDEMLKGIAVASANDGCVAMAEHIAGSEDEFVRRMNEKAKALGMKNTHFVNTNGLDTDGHYSSARDVAIMSRELLKHELIFNYTTIWTDTIRNGKFELANTNKLIRFYDGANGLKTGSTSGAKCCLCATAKRNGMQLIAVVLGAPDSKNRFSSARNMLDFGFANYKYNKVVEKNEKLCVAAVKNGEEKNVAGVAEESYGEVAKIADNKDYEKEIKMYELKAPISARQKIGEVNIKKNNKTIKKINIIADKNIEKKSFSTALFEVFSKMII